MRILNDQLGNTVEIPDAAPARIVSLVPSQTELLYDLGLGDRVAGITKFCVHPQQWFRSKTRVGGTKDLKIDTIAGLNPDLIIANKEENVKEQVEILRNCAPVWVSDVNSLGDATEMIAAIGSMTATAAAASLIIENISRQFDALVPLRHAPKTAYLIWKDPYMAVAGGTFIHDMMHRCGFRNVFGTRQRYPETSVEELSALGVELVLLSSEPYPFNTVHRDALQAALPAAKVLLADGEMFSWYGSRLQLAPAYFNHLLAPLR
ncbi:MAG TPA: helical backbone metal receptor [Chitinophagaceae bacterium]